jgi:hypothetical protein
MQLRCGKHTEVGRRVEEEIERDSWFVKGVLGMGRKERGRRKKKTVNIIHHKAALLSTFLRLQQMCEVFADG